ncbi:MAG: 4-(cytidine 5'-diphospho)-2-C-methyl-D-erythritol kinase [Candidatus Symbiothrix sp.]|jgi:4-diphosphocytidyl-2-C-methyl-D-erythritol kinase|nr:4-(cytidine 5'-diphospho)-2-C-methyl-D-erythritol kinase [Candidatus Symbiothrix sp.]
MLTFPNAKINLGLNIVAKRADGYHDIETVFYPVPLCDALEIVPCCENMSRKGIACNAPAFIQTGIPVDGDPQTNLVMKAYNLLKADFDLPELTIYLQKNIPFGAGLGGGSADAAFMLKLLNDYAKLGLTVSQLETYARKLGADCPFFIQNQPVFAEGIGDVFSPVTVSLKGYYLLLIKPDIHVSTRDAYAQVKVSRPELSIKEIVQTPVETWKDRLVNDFENSVGAKFPEIHAIRQFLYAKGALYAAMSGSGSTVFGIFSEDPFYRMLCNTPCNSLRAKKMRLFTVPNGTCNWSAISLYW